MNNKIDFQMSNGILILFKILLLFNLLMIKFYIISLFLSPEILFINLLMLIVSVLMLLVILISLNNLYKSITFEQDYFIIETLLNRMYKIEYDDVVKVVKYKIVTKKRMITLKKVKNKNEIIVEINKKILVIN